MVPDIWSGTERIFLHFGPILDLLPPNNPANQDFDKMKKPLGDIIISHMCTKTYDQMMYGS